MIDISFLIPSKNEPYLEKTVESIKRKAKSNIEVLYKEDYGIGQRALTNELAREAKGKYVVKVDAHCLFSNSFDVKLLEYMDDKTIMAPFLMPLDAENWQAKHFPKHSQFVFDPNLVMQHAPEQQGMITETMCMQGSFWMVDRNTYWDWNLGGEELGSWGFQGTELGIKAYLNGGTCKVIKHCFYAHLFRETEQDFPYKRDKKAMKKTKNTFLKKYKNKDIAGLIEKYNYPAGWSKELVEAL